MGAIVAYIVYITVILGCSMVCAYLARHIGAGRGDELIAGYNMASKEQREIYDITKLRKIISVMLYIVSALLLLFIGVVFLPQEWIMASILILTAVLFLVVYVAIAKGNRCVVRK